MKVAISFARQHTVSDISEYVQKNPLIADEKLLEMQAKVPFLDVRQHTRVAGATEQVQVVAFLATSSWISALRASGTDGACVRPFFENDKDEVVYPSMPLPRDAYLDAAIRQAAFIRDIAF